MSKFTTKAELLADIRTQRRRLESHLANLTATEMCQSGVSGSWSVKDILAHLAAWEQMFLGWYRAGLRGETPEIPAPGLTWGQLHLLNQHIYERFRDTPLEAVLARYRESYREIAALVEALPDEELLTPGRYPWLRGERLVDWIAPNTCNHYAWAKNLVRTWKKAAPLPQGNDQ